MGEAITSAHSSVQSRLAPPPSPLQNPTNARHEGGHASRGRIQRIIDRLETTFILLPAHPLPAKSIYLRAQLADYRLPWPF